MELVYIWTKMEDKEYNFNFSKEHDIKYNSKEKRISLTTKKSRLNIFSENKGKGGVNQVYALIGKNGSGKTTLLRTFLEYDYLDRLRKKFEIVCLFKDKDKYYKIYTNDFIRLDNEMYINIKNKDKHYTPENLEDKLAPIYYNPYLGNYLTSSNIHPRGDISYERRFSNSYSENCFKVIWSKDIKSIYTMFSAVRKENKLEEFNNIVTNKNKDSFKEIKILFFPITDESLNTNNLKTSFDNISELDFEDHYNFKGYNDYSESKKSFIKEFYKKILLKINGSSENLNLNFNKSFKSIKKINFKEIEKWINEIENKINNTTDKVENKQDIDDLRDKIKDFKKFKETVDFLDSLIHVYKHEIRKKDKNKYLYFEITLEKVLNEDEIWNEFINLVSKRYIEIETGFSDGEWSMLKLFANLYNELNALHNENKNEFLIILDEGDMGFHPEWQRKYLNTMINFFNKIFSNKTINLILASHSPFIASDLPKENVIFMGVEDDPELKTFGANIHELYKESFFIESTMGEFALSKIKSVIEDLTTLECIQRADRKLKELEKKGEKLSEIKKQEKDKLKKSTSERVRKKSKIEEKKKTIKYIIDQIGERVLSRKLGEKYREIFGEEETEEDRLYKQWKDLSKEKQLELLNKEFGGQ